MRHPTPLAQVAEILIDLACEAKKKEQAEMKYKGIPLREIHGKHYFEDLELTERRPTDGVGHPDLQNAFIERHGLRESKSRMFPYWLRLFPPGYRTADATWEGPKEAHEIMSGVDDHAYLFMRNGRYVYTTQPYDARLEEYQAVEKYWTELGLFVGISLEDAWWYPGRTPLIVIAQEPLELTGFRPEGSD